MLEIPRGNRPRIQIVSKPASPRTGIGRYVTELEKGLAQRAIDFVCVPLRNPIPGRVTAAAQGAGYDLQTFFASYPLRVQARGGYQTHLTSQTLGTLLLSQRLPRPVIATVHDILPYLVRNDRGLNVYRTNAQRLLDILAMRGLRRADRLIADSNYTKSTLTGALGIRADHIDVVHLGVDCRRFQPGEAPASFRMRYRLTDDRPYLLFVGSEDPRKNLHRLIRALPRVRQEFPNATLLKVGAAAFDDQRRANEQLCADLGLSTAVRFIDDVDEDDLPDFYRLASLFAFPSLYEGFGFPVLEALACGTPVVAANATSVPELTGDAAVLVDGRSVEAFAAALIDQLRAGPSDPRPRVQQAAGFTWSQTIDGTLASYARAKAAGRTRRRREQYAPVALSQRVDR